MKKLCLPVALFETAILKQLVMDTSYSQGLLGSKWCLLWKNLNWKLIEHGKKTWVGSQEEKVYSKFYSQSLICHKNLLNVMNYDRHTNQSLTPQWGFTLYQWEKATWKTYKEHNMEKGWRKGLCYGSSDK